MSGQSQRKKRMGVSQANGLGGKSMRWNNGELLDLLASRWEDRIQFESSDQ